LKTSSRERAIELVGEHCDLAERLQQVPPSARIRGLWFGVVEAEMRERGLTPEFRRIFGPDDFGALRFHWAGDYLMRAAVAGALVAGPAGVHAGMHEIARRNATRFADSLLGRALIRLLASDPLRLAQQGVAARRQTMSYGHWGVVPVCPGTIDVRLQSEYIWIESHVVGSWVGTLETIGVHPEIGVEMSGPFDGVIRATFPARGPTESSGPGGQHR
jgi:uncharacterized protein (TIGR02265 family)